MKSELCKTCIHTKLCLFDKNIIGDDIFVPGNPAFFDNNKLFAEYEKRKEYGFPCEDYFPSARNVGQWKNNVGDGYMGGGSYECTACGWKFSWEGYFELDEYDYCPHCGAKMKK